MAALTKVEWMLENPESESSLHWCQHYHFHFPAIKSEGMVEVGGNHYYAYVEGDDGGETWKHQGDAIQYLEDTVTRLTKEKTS
jgi:hypothetical protein